MSDGDGITANTLPSKVTCYSGGESGFMEWGRELRGRVLRPLLDTLSRLGMRANHVTLVGLIIGLAFCPVFLWGSKALAFGLLALHVLALKTLTGFLTKRRRI